jgi:hypothetical protein
LTDSEILITGYARLPKGITAAELYKTVGIAVLVDKETGVILDIECSLATNLARQFVRRIAKGHNLNNFESIEKEFDKHYYGSATKAITSAIKSCSDKYNQIL